MRSIVACLGVSLLTGSARITGQLVDRNKALNTEDEGISRPLTSDSYPTQIGDGRWGTDSNSSLNVIAFDRPSIGE